MNNSNLSFFKTLYNHNGNKFILVNFIINSKININSLDIFIYGSDNFKYKINVKINKLDNPYINSFIAKKGISYFIKIDINSNTSTSEEITKFYKINEDYEYDEKEMNNIEMIISKLQKYTDKLNNGITVDDLSDSNIQYISDNDKEY